MSKKNMRTVGRILILSVLSTLFLLPNTMVIGAANGVKTVHGYVWPMVTQDWIPGLMERHDIVVELRETFHTPAAPGLSAAATQTDSDGNGEFSIEDVPPGDYVLVIKRPGYLARCMNVTISGSDPDVIELSPPDTDPMDSGVFVLWWGDCDGDLTIDDDDLLMLQGLWNVSASNINYDPACDLDGNGRIDNSDALMLMMRYGYSSVDYAGAEGVDFSLGSGIVNATVKLALSQGYEYRVPITARNVTSFTGKAITITYDQAALELRTVAEQVYGKYVSTGVVPGSMITITSISPGVVVFTYDAAIPQGSVWSGVISVLKFEALTNGATTVHME